MQYKVPRSAAEVSAYVRGRVAAADFCRPVPEPVPATPAASLPPDLAAKRDELAACLFDSEPAPVPFTTSLGSPGADSLSPGPEAQTATEAIEQMTARDRAGLRAVLREWERLAGDYHRNCTPVAACVARRLLYVVLTERGELAGTSWLEALPDTIRERNGNGIAVKAVTP